MKFKIFLSVAVLLVLSVALNVFLLTKPAPVPPPVQIQTNNSLPAYPVPATNAPDYALIYELNRYRTEPFSLTNEGAQYRGALVDRYFTFKINVPVKWNIFSFGIETTAGIVAQYQRRLIKELDFYAGPMFAFNPWNTNINFGILGSVIF